MHPESVLQKGGVRRGGGAAPGDCLPCCGRLERGFPARGSVDWHGQGSDVGGVAREGRRWAGLISVGLECVERGIDWGRSSYKVSALL